MAILRIDEMRKMTVEQRNKELSELKAELSSLMSKMCIGGSLENPARVGLIKKTIAQFYTISREEALGLNKAKVAKEKEKGKQKGKEKEKVKESAELKKAEKKQKVKKQRKGDASQEHGEKEVIEE
jgi:large subunit ribosomal protein L29